MADVRFQVPPDDYSKAYFSDLLRDIRQTFSQLLTPTTTTIGRLIFVPPPVGVPTSGNNQVVGTVYVDGDILKMVVASTGYAATYLLTAYTGTVTATGS